MHFCQMLHNWTDTKQTLFILKTYKFSYNDKRYNFFP